MTETNVETAIDILVPEITSSFTISKSLRLSLVGFAGLAIGFGVGYYISKRKLSTRYDELLKKEIEDTKKFYNVLHKKDDFSTPELVVESYETAIELYSGDNEVVEPKIMNIFKNSEEDSEDTEEDSENTEDVEDPEDQEWDAVSGYGRDDDWDDDDAVYVISEKEWWERTSEYEQQTLSYFDGDDVLTDSHDKPISDIDSVIGDRSLQKFGWRCGDKDTVFVRNDNLEIDFEVVRIKGKFTEEVFGIIEHSSLPKKYRMFRGDDE